MPRLVKKSSVPVEVEVVALEGLVQDGENANAGTLRGMQLLDRSISRLGLGRGVLLDKNRKLIAGNKTQERAIDQGFTEAILVHTTGDRLVAVVRDDLDLDEDQRARELAVADNRVAEVNLEWSAEAMEKLQETAPESVGNYFFPDEIERILQVDQTGGPRRGRKKDQVEPDLTQLGDPRTVWPEVRIRVHPDTYAMYEELQEVVEGKDESERFGKIVKLALDAAEEDD